MKRMKGVLREAVQTNNKEFSVMQNVSKSLQPGMTHLTWYIKILWVPTLVFSLPNVWISNALFIYLFIFLPSFLSKTTWLGELKDPVLADCFGRCKYSLKCPNFSLTVVFFVSLNGFVVSFSPCITRWRGWLLPHHHLHPSRYESQVRNMYSDMM